MESYLADIESQGKMRMVSLIHIRKANDPFLKNTHCGNFRLPNNKRSFDYVVQKETDLFDHTFAKRRYINYDYFSIQSLQKSWSKKVWLRLRFKIGSWLASHQRCFEVSQSHKTFWFFSGMHIELSRCSAVLVWLGWKWADWPKMNRLLKVLYTFLSKNKMFFVIWRL